MTEDDVEQLVMGQLGELGYTCMSDSVAGPGGVTQQRVAYSDVILEERLAAAIARLNPDMPEAARGEALRAVKAMENPALGEENRRLAKLMREGVKVEYVDDEGRRKGGLVRLIDFSESDDNDWLAINQFTVVERGHKRRPDVVLFVNGLPVVVIELKNPGSAAADLGAAYQQLQTYKAEVPSLFRSNVALIISDGLFARVGSLTANFERFMPWRTISGKRYYPPIIPEDDDPAGTHQGGPPEHEVLIPGVCDPRHLLRLLRDFSVFGNKGDGLFKIVAGYHQYHAVQKAVEATVKATAAGGDRKIGVIWHTQGSGKSLLMAFYAGQLVGHEALQNPTLLIITDRNDLDDQLYGTFSLCHDLIRQTPLQAQSRAHLRELLNRNAGGVVFSTIQNFGLAEGEDDYPLLTDRRNVVVMADEAHRSQYGLEEKLNQKTGKVTLGFAGYLRDGLPNASFIGFTGTPIETADVNTPGLFGEYIDTYDISRAVEDGATVPIYYESRLVRIDLPEDELEKLDAEIDALLDEDETTSLDKLTRQNLEKLVGSKERLQRIAKDLVEHFEARIAAQDGKGMIVCMSRRICVALYDEIVALRPDWHSEDDAAGALKIVMTSSASDPEAWSQHGGSKARRDKLAKRARDPDDPLKLVIVCDMWLTGFDAPPMHTMYIDKPMKGHGLMQSIARVNRVFRDKPSGLVVDYIGIAQRLKEALQQYSRSDRGNTGIDEAEAERLLREHLDIVRGMFHGFDYQEGIIGDAQTRLRVLALGLAWITRLRDEEARAAKDDKERKKALQRYPTNAARLKKAFKLAAASDFARQVRGEVAFFLAIAGALQKGNTGGAKSEGKVRDFAIQQLIDQSVHSLEVVDILGAIGIDRPDISILSDEFLADLAQMEHRNLAIDALRKLLNGQIQARMRTNVTEQKRFSEALEQAITRYHNNAVTSAQVLQEMIEMAREVMNAASRGEAEGLSQEELAFYDALSSNESAVDIMGNDELKVIAQELLTSLRASVSIDWAHRESVRARLRSQIKRILRKHGYPPDLQDGAVQTVLAQAEALSAELLGEADV